MKSRWFGVALLAAGLGVGVASGQPSVIPTPVGAARLPEPIPISQPLPPMTTGPLNSYTAPPGPDASLSLPAGHSSAFQSEEFVRDQGFFSEVGTFALSRQGMGTRLLGVIDPVGLDTGIAPLIATPTVNFHDVDGHAQWGVSAAIGYMCENQAIEAKGWYMLAGNATSTVNNPGRLDLPFTNPPLGFEGDNGLWLQADQVTIQRITSLGSGEINYRYTNKAVSEFELIIGVRYLDLRERLDIVTSDDGFTFPNIFGQSDARRDAVYQVETHNRVVAPQIGIEYEYSRWLLHGMFSFGFSAKVASGVNLSETHHRLFRGDSFFGFDAVTNETTYSTQIFDTNAFIEAQITEKCRLKAGYNFIWLTGVKIGQDQIDFDLRNHAGNDNTHGSVYFHGPSLELEFLY